MPRVSGSRIFVSLLIFFAVLLSVSQTILYLWNTPAGAVYPFVHNFVEDYYIYLDIMRQGWDGWWVVTSRMTPEVYPRMVVSVFLLTLGHVAAWLHLSLPVVYTGARVVGGVALMTLVYQLIRLTFPQSFIKRFVAFCFVLFGTYFWGWGSNGPIVASLPHAWTELDPIFRWSFIPHHLWSKVGMLAVFLLLLRTRFTLRDAFILSVVVFLTGMTNPVVYATLVPVVGLWFLLEVGRDKACCMNAKQILPWIVVGTIAVVVLLYHRYLQTNIFPWTSYLQWEQTLTYKVNPIEYAVSFGPTLVLFLLAIPTIWRLGRVGSLLLAWAASSWIMLYIVGPFVPVTPERFLGGYQFTPLGIGAAVWIFSLKRQGLLRLGLIIFLLGYFAIGLRASFTEAAGYVAANKNNPQVYVSNDLMAAFTYLSVNSKSEDVVIAPYEISTMIPGLTGRRVVAGHVMFTKDVALKKSLINEFFTTRDPAVANRIVNTYQVRWILTSQSWIPPMDFRLEERFSTKSYVLYSINSLLQ